MLENLSKSLKSSSGQRPGFFVFIAASFILMGLLFSANSNADGITSIARNNKLIRQGEEAMKKKDWKSAISSYESIIGNTEKPVGQVYLNLGNAYAQLNNEEKALKNYHAALPQLESPGLKSVTYQQMGNLFFKKKDYRSALDWYKKSLKSNPKNENARFNYELAYRLNQQEEEQRQKEEKNNPENKDQKKDEKEKRENKAKEQNQNEPAKADEKEKQPGSKDQKKGGKDSKEKEKKGNEDEQASEKETRDEKNNSNINNNEEVDPKGSEDSKDKNKEARADEQNVSRVDKKKLQEIGLSEDQAKILLQAMRQSEIKYLQQRRFGNRKGLKNSRPRW